MHLESLLSKDLIPVLIPLPFYLDFSRYIEAEEVKDVELEGLISSSKPFFIKSEGGKNQKVKLALMSAQQLHAWQRIVNGMACEEAVYPTSQGHAIAYVREERFSQLSSLTFNPKLEADINAHGIEWDCKTDIYTLIPMAYNPKTIRRRSSASEPECPDNVYTVIDCLDFRSKFESGVYVENKLSNAFQERIKREFLEIVTLSLYKEQTYDEQSPETIGIPVDAALVLSMDTNTNSAVLHIILISNGLFPTQYLDSVSRNQLYVISDGDKKNIYQYLEEKYGLNKRGKAKHFINIHKKRDEINNDLLASMLYCETFFQFEENIGKVIDPEILQKTGSQYGEAQYNYASAFFHYNCVIQTYNDIDSIRNRIITQSIALFYIEMVLFEEAAIEIMNYEMIHFLTDIDRYSHHKIIKHINSLLNQHLKTIAFWDVKINYPSSNKSLNLIKEAFKINDLRKEVDRNKENLISVSELRENYLSYWESRIISVLGVLLTIFSIAEFIIDPSKSRSLIFIGLGCVFIWLILFKKLSNKGRSNASRLR